MRRRDIRDCHIVTTPTGAKVLIDKDNHDYDGFLDLPGYTIEQATAKNITMQLLADDLDQDAENGNYHDLVGAYNDLAGILVEFVSLEKGRLVMLELWERGGFIQ